MAISMPGMGSGLDINLMVQTMVQAEMNPSINQLKKSETNINTELAALQQLEEALTTFNDTLDKLSDPDEFGSLKISMDEDAGKLFGMRITDGAMPNSYQIQVDQLAAKHKVSVFSGADEVPAGDYTITVGGETMTLTVDDSNNTLKDVMETINKSEDNPGVTASIVNGANGAELVLTSNETGKANAIEISKDGTALQPKELQKAQDAILFVDGIEIHSTSNKVENAIEGVTIDLKKAQKGEVFRVDVEPDQGAMTESINTLIDSYNTLFSTIKGLTRAPVGQPRPALASDSMTQSMLSQLRSALSTPVAGSSFNTLAELGIVTTMNGDLEVDDDRLKEALEANPMAVADVFTGSEGVIANLQSVVDQYIGGEDDKGTSKDGLLETRIEGLNDELSDIGDEWKVLDQRAENLTERYTAQFVAMDLAIQQMNATMSSLTYL